MKRVVRVQIVSERTADITADEYSWRKYGEKSLEGSPHLRLDADEYSWRKYGEKSLEGSPHLRRYYKCSGVRGCPARKHVEKALDDPSVFVVTYEGDHNHLQHVTDAMVAAARDSNGSRIQSGPGGPDSNGSRMGPNILCPVNTDLRLGRF